MTPRFSISILAHNNLELTKRCIYSIVESATNYELILTDNGSTDGTTEWLLGIVDYFDAPECKNITVITNEKNEGFINPNRKALEMAKGDFFILANNDISDLPKGWLDMLAAPFEKDPLCALSAPECCASRLLDNLQGRRCAPNQMEYLEGSCLCIKTEIARKHGLFSDWLVFAYGEDADLGLRMRELGYNLHTVPFTFHHVHGATSSKVEGVREIEKNNHEKMRERWKYYLLNRRMDYPIYISRTGAVGDVLLTTPLIRALSKQKPLSPIYVDTRTPGVFHGNPMVKRTVVAGFDEISGKACQVIDLNMAYENRPNTNIVSAYFEAAGMKENGDSSPEIYFTGHDMEFADSHIGDNFVAIHASPTTWRGKNWPEQFWNRVACNLMAQGYEVVLVGAGKADINVSCTTNLVNKTTIQQLAAVLKCCTLFVGHDSFPMHCAMAVGTRAVGLFGMSHSRIVIPRGAKGTGIDADPNHPNAGIRHKTAGVTMMECTDNPMLTITPERVIETLKGFLK